LKKRILTALIFLFLLSTPYIQGQSWLWARDAKQANGAEGCAIATDLLGNVYATGSFGPPSIIFGTDTLRNTGNMNVFLVKYDGLGNLIWAKSAGGGGSGSNADVSEGIATDISGNVYITGFFQAPTITFGTITLTNSGGQNIFIVKYDANGNVLWAQNPPGNSNDLGSGIATDISGNVYLTGWFSSHTLAFGSYTLTNAGNQNVFLAKYDPSGNVQWAKSAGGTMFDSGFSVNTDQSGGVYVSGFIRSPASSFGAYVLANSGIQNVFLAKYDASGNVLWAKSGGGAGTDYGLSAVTDAAGNTYFTGWFNSPVLTFGSQALTNMGADDAFLVKYDATGNVIWAQSFGGPLVDHGYSLVKDRSGNIILSGGYNSSSITFGSFVLPYPGGGTDPTFIVKFDANGISSSALSLASGGDDNNSIAVDSIGSIYLGGDFWENPFVVGNDTLLRTGTETIFVSKFGSASREKECPDIFIPSAFSPNGDGINDQECLYGQDCIQSIYFAIYDRWGEKIFETTDKKHCWDGTFNGQRMDDAVFVYYIRATLTSGSAFTKKGNITLIR
jgi:gliding motility-associated-like protein